MAKLGFDYQVDVESTDKQFSGGAGPLPHMYALVWAEALTINKTKDDKGYKADITFEVVEPEKYKGRKIWTEWTMMHPDGFNLGAYKYGKPMFDKFSRAVGIMVDANTELDDLLRRTFVIETGLNKGQAVQGKTGEFYPDKTQIQRFFYSDENAKEPIPELGLIGDGEWGEQTPRTARPAAANNNQPAAANSNAPASERPKISWGAKK